MTDAIQNPIDSLEAALWRVCVRQRAATNREQIERWQSDERAHLAERFLITPAPAEYAAQIDAALTEWDAIEATLLTPPQHGAFVQPGKDRHAFLDEFAEVRRLHLAGEELPQPLMRLCLGLAGKVRNMDWVNLFALLLPAADPERRAEHIARARMVVAVFYMEKVGRVFLVSSSADEEDLRKIEGRWGLVAEK